MFSPFGFGGIGIVIIIVALVDFIRRKPDLYWLFIILFLGPLGSLIYIFVEMVPSISANRGQIKWMERRRRISRIEAEVRGNPSAGNFEELGMLYLDAGNYSRAKWAYDQALNQRTDSIDTFYRRATCEIELAQFPAAAKDLEHVIAKDVSYDFGRALGLYAHALAQTGDAAHAQTVFEEAAKINTSSEFMVEYAEFLLSQGRKNEAREWARRVLDKRPLMPPYQRRREGKWLRRAARI
ncbi:MAG: tetratricopeptide repeat protein [Acidobacteriaceae bacterium]